ncbi:MAG TPA: adenylyltransferase/cytidyltransferase family protein [Candidatus Deferrimicrobium sp.]|nr:adenylyltransferase/cytidyltransferase family protein [Candidatus Deferrimicrobium sp.]
MLRGKGNLDPTIVRGRIGIVDAALIRCLENFKNNAENLSVYVTESIYQNIIPIDHIHEFLTELSPVDGVITGHFELERILHQPGATLNHLPGQELTRYAAARILKKVDIESNGHRQENEKLAAVEELLKIYGANPKERRLKVGLVSGSFDLIHLGHVRYIKAAKKQCDVLVVATMSTGSIRQQEKNSRGDRPIYSQEDRIKLLSALKSVDHIVVFPELDCKEVIKNLKPNFFIKNANDIARQIVKEECRLVESLNGKVIVSNDDLQYSSTDIIDYIRKASKGAE